MNSASVSAGKLWLTVTTNGVEATMETGTKVLVGVIVELVGQRRKREQGDGPEEQGIAVRLGMSDVGGADDSASADIVLHDEVLLELGLQLLRGQARQHVADAAGGIRHDQGDRSLGPRRLRGRR